MTRELPADWLNACLDNELSSDERATAAARLAANSSEHEQLCGLRELDQQLRRVLVAPHFSEVEFLARLDRRTAHVTLRVETDHGVFGHTGHSNDPGSRRIRTATVATAVALLSAIAVLILVPRFSAFSPSAIPRAGDFSVAQVVRTIGVVEYLKPQSLTWKQMKSGAAVPVVAGTRLRTPLSSLCEVETSRHGILRLNQETELVVHKADRIELVSGELWCSTAAGPTLTILVPESKQGTESNSAAQPLHSFACAANTATQWAVTERETQCLGVSDSPAELALPGKMSCSIEPGQTLSVRKDSHPVATGHEDRLLAMGWQLPLLVIRRPDDPELQSRLQSLLAMIGQTKMSSMYESQIHSLGPAGTIPLIAFVRSQESLTNPELRQSAMRIIAELAPVSTRTDLEFLAMDADPTVSQLASAALVRLGIG